MYLIFQSSSVAGADTLIPGATDIPAPTFIPRYLEGQSAVNIQHVACGDFHTACLTGIVLKDCCKRRTSFSRQTIGGECR